jgi:hypothetical protein
MAEEERRVIADYFVIAGLPKDKEKLQLLDEYSLEVNLKPSAYQDPITDVTVSVALYLCHVDKSLIDKRFRFR